jgi:hypothetical protein
MDDQMSLYGGEPKSALRKWYEKIGGHQGAMQRAKVHVVSGGNAIRQSGEAIVVGGALGALNSHRGSLDFHLRMGGRVHEIPIDAVIGVVGVGAAVVLAHENVSDDLRNSGAAALTVFAYRKAQDYMNARNNGSMPAQLMAPPTVMPAAPAAAGATVAAHGEDPIIALAKRL